MARSVIRRLWKPVIAVLTVSGSLFATTATAAEHRAAAVPPGDYCGSQEGFYGGGQYTYAEVQACLHFEDGGPPEVRVSTHNNSYYWGSAWYNASASYPAQWRAEGAVSKDGQTATYSASLRQESRDGWAGGGQLPASECGAATVTLNFHQSGPYWTGSDNDINSGERTYQIDVPC
ncbi:hypothetical protein [Streptomyces sp. NPDC053079]|uniref:hypothetical protein n=1 Tax=Streptomyces sp. NPDC053079 TaxID=3365697 RepID=UPI0037D5984A